MVGIGPGGREHRTARAEQVIRDCEVVAGYTTYMALIEDLTAGKELIVTGMTQEVERCRAALARAVAGKQVAVVCSGDPGIYGMAGLVLELAERDGCDVPVEVVPGVTAASAAAAAVGAPLMCDFAVVSLSDLLVPWASIRRRVAAVAAADLVVVFYNPRSTRRVTQLTEAVEILRQHRPATTPVAVVTAAGNPDQEIILTDLAGVDAQPVTMRSVVIVGNSLSRVVNGRLVTGRGYEL